MWPLTSTCRPEGREALLIPFLGWIKYFSSSIDKRKRSKPNQTLTALNFKSISCLWLMHTVRIYTHTSHNTPKGGDLTALQRFRYFLTGLHKTATTKQIQFTRGQILFLVMEKCAPLSRGSCFCLKCTSRSHEWLTRLAVPSNQFLFLFASSGL